MDLGSAGAINAFAARARPGAFVLVGLVAGGCSKHLDASADPGPSVIGSLTGEARVTAGEHGFVPSSLTLAKGAPGTTRPVIFVRTSEKTCATEVSFPELGIQRPLPLDTPISVEVPTDAIRTLTFQCGMGMYKGAMVVR